MRGAAVGRSSSRDGRRIRRWRARSTPRARAPRPGLQIRICRGRRTTPPPVGQRRTGRTPPLRARSTRAPWFRDGTQTASVAETNRVRISTIDAACAPAVGRRLGPCRAWSTAPRGTGADVHPRRHAANQSAPDWFAGWHRGRERWHVAHCRVATLGRGQAPGGPLRRPDECPQARTAASPAWESGWASWDKRGRMPRRP